MPRNDRVYETNADRQRAYRERQAAGDLEIYRSMRRFLYDELETWLQENVTGAAERARYRRILGTHLPVK